MINYGKKFEERFKLDWKNTVEDSCIVRLYDNMSGFRSISNISDFICYKQPNLFFIECKAHAGASIPFTAISQYYKLVNYMDVPGVRAGIVVWLYEKDLVLYVPIKTIKKLKEKGEKSVGVRHLDNERIIKIPSEKLRTFMKSDYSVLQSLHEGD